MGKSKTEEAKEVENLQPEAQQEQQPTGGDFLQTLNEKGTIIILSPTREGLGEIINTIPAEVKYSVGAVGRNYETQEFTLRLDIIK
ncbi:MAG: hypothetical protein IKA00_08505 [Prevotella sp.]|nr:hypothetical protein [Prevotella sp.]